jgi:HD superfamily phosphohydrolase
MLTFYEIYLNLIVITSLIYIHYQYGFYHEILQKKIALIRKLQKNLTKNKRKMKKLLSRLEKKEKDISFVVNQINQLKSVKETDCNTDETDVCHDDVVSETNDDVVSKTDDDVVSETNDDVISETYDDNNQCYCENEEEECREQVDDCEKKEDVEDDPVSEDIRKCSFCKRHYEGGFQTHCGCQGFSEIGIDTI